MQYGVEVLTDDFVDKLEKDNPGYEYQWVGWFDWRMHGMDQEGWEGVSEGWPPEPGFDGAAIGLVRRRRPQ